MPAQRIPLVGQLTQREVGEFVQKFENVHFDPYINEATGKASFYCLPQEGYETSSAPGASTTNGSAIKVWTGNANKIVTAFGATNSTIYMDTTSLGAITGIAGYISETTVSGIANLAIVSESNRGYFYDAVAATLTEITDTDFPPKQTPALTITGNFAHLDGYAFIACTNGQIWNSALNSLSSWLPLSYVTASQKPDGLLGVLRYRDYIVALGTASIEFFYNAGNAAGSPLSRVQDSASSVGCIGQYAMVPFADNIAWAGTQDGGIGIFMLDGLKPTRISTGPVDTWVRQASGVNQVRLHVISSYGSPRLLVTYNDPSVNNVGVLYDPKLKLWTRMNLGARYLTQTDNQALLNGTTQGTFFVGQNSDGKYWRNANYGLGTTIIRTDRLDFGTSGWKTCNGVTLIGATYNQSKTFTLQWCDTDLLLDYNTGRTVSMSISGTAGQMYPRISRCGSFKKRSFQLSWASANTASDMQRMEALEFDIT